MHRYFATFVAGTHKIIENILQDELESFKIEDLLENLIVFQTSDRTDDLIHSPYLSNLFLLINKFGSVEMQNFGAIMSWCEQRSKFLEYINKFSKQNNHKSFRVQFFEDTKSVSNRNELEALTKLISQNTHLKYSPNEADLEIWFLKRSEGVSFIGLRLTRKHDYKEVLKQGELRPELAYILNYLAEISSEDTVLDPFCGSGAIPISVARHFEAESIVASDIDTENIHKVIAERGFGDLDVDVKNYNGFSLDEVGDDSVDKIVTDPPWGEFENVDSLYEKYRSMLQSFKRILVPGGIIVLLMSENLGFHKIINEFRAFNLADKYSVMVGGRKSEIFKILKN